MFYTKYTWKAMSKIIYWINRKVVIYLPLLATETMNTRQDVALRYHDKKVIGNISDEGSCVYILIPHSRRIKHAPKCYGAKSLSKFIQFMKLKYLVINAPD